MIKNIYNIINNNVPNINNITWIYFGTQCIKYHRIGGISACQRTGVTLCRNCKSTICIGHTNKKNNKCINCIEDNNCKKLEMISICNMKEIFICYYCSSVVCDEHMKLLHSIHMGPLCAISCKKCYEEN